MTPPTDQELAQAMADNIDADGNDVGLERWVASWTPEQRARSLENQRQWIEAAQQAIRGKSGGAG